MSDSGKTNDTLLKRCVICFNSNKISPSSIKYFQLPSDPDVAAQWFRNLNRNELVKHLFQKNYASSVWICSDHFAKSAIRLNPTDTATVTLDPAALPLIVEADRKTYTAKLSAAERNILFCRQKPVETELSYFRTQFEKYQHFKQYRIHCTTCDAHINLAPINKDQIRVHNFLKVIQCDKCFHFDAKGGPLPMNKDVTIQCQCGIANTLVKCYCTAIFCKECNWKNTLDRVSSKCLWCTPTVTLDLRALQWAVFKVLDFKYKTITTNEKYKNFTTKQIQKLLEKDLSGCCVNAPVSEVPRETSTNGPLSLAIQNPATYSKSIVKQRRPPETEISNTLPVKKIIVSNLVGKPVVVDKMTANDVILQNCHTIPPLTRISKVIVTEKVPIIASVTSIAAKEQLPAPSIPMIEQINQIPKPNVNIIQPVKSYSKKPPNSMLPPNAKKGRSRPVLDDRCLQIKSNFKNNGTFLKTLCDHFMFKVENMQQTKSSSLHLHEQLISAIGDICDKLESIKEKCLEDLDKCSEAPMKPVLPKTVKGVGKDDDDLITVSNSGMLPNDDEEEDEEVYELYDIIDTDFPECDVSIQESDGETNAMQV